MSRLLTFDTTHHALWAEQIATDRGLGVQVVAAPAESHARCDLALEVLEEDVGELEEALRAAGVRYRPWGS